MEKQTQPARKLGDLEQMPLIPEDAIPFQLVPPPRKKVKGKPAPVEPEKETPTLPLFPDDTPEASPEPRRELEPPYVFYVPKDCR